ncbi:MAG: rod shape-determining protein [Clostridia bacterium]|nr:rod shape-determining protein [Clostridia bacterium]
MAIFGLNGIGMDLGSMQTSIYLASEEEIVLREPTQVLVNAENMTDILCVGSEARAMTGRTAKDTELVSPIQNGVVADIDLTALLMLALAEKATGRKKPMEKSLLVTGLMGGATRVERGALFQAMNATGAKRTAAVLNPVAAALGAGVDISRPRGTLVASLGGGATEIAVLSMNSVVALRMLRFGGQSMDEAIVRWYWREKGIIIGMRTAEQLKREIGTVDADDVGADDDPVLLKGKEAATGRPMSLETTGLDVMRALEDPVRQLVDAMRNALYNIPAELAVDIHHEGIYLSGGGAQLRGLAGRLEKETGVPVNMSSHPREDVVLGLGMAASSEKLLNTLARTGAAELTAE